MSQTILIEDNVDFKKILSLNLNTYAGTDIVDRADADDAISLLAILPSISLIICKNKIGEEHTAQKIYNYLEDNQLDIPMVVMGENEKLAKNILVMEEPLSWETIVKKSARLLGVTEEEELRKKIKPNYVSVSSYYFYEIDHTPCDIYIRIKKGPSEYSFVKRIHAQESFTNEDIEKYESQGLKEFYVPRDYQQYFVTFVTNNIIQKLENTNLELVDRLETNAVAYNIVKDHINNVGFDESIIELSTTSIDSMITATKENPKLASLLKMLLTTKISYAYQKAHLVCVIGDFILSRQNWYEDKHRDIFTFVAFFSDITLKSVDQIRINSSDEVSKAKISIPDKKSVLTHADDAANLIKEHPNHSEYIELVIRQHHGDPEGKSFPDEPAEEIHPIAKVHIIADAFVKIMLDPNAPKNKKDILTILYAQYSNSSYQKIIKVLEQKIN